MVENKVWYPRQVNLENLANIGVGDIIEFSENQEDKEPITKIDISKRTIKTQHGEEINGELLIHVYKINEKGEFMYRDSEYVQAGLK